MRGWTLQKMRTRPGLVNVKPFASPRPYWPRSNWFGSLAENTLWSKGSWFAKRTVEPTGSATTRGTKSLSSMAISTVAGRAAEVGGGPVLLLEDRDAPGDPRAPPPALRRPVLPPHDAPRAHQQGRPADRASFHRGRRPFRSRAVSGPRSAMSARAA